MSPEHLPSIGFGTGTLSGGLGEQAVVEAIVQGYRLIDTANNQYYDQPMVGRAIQTSGIDRDKLTIIGKGAHDAHEHGRAAIESAVQQSLQDLGLDYLDYFLIHWPRNPSKRQETWQALVNLRHRSNTIQEIGVSNYAVHHLQELEASGVTPAINQIEFHVYNQQKQLRRYCQQQGITVVGYATFAGGYADDDPLINQIAYVHGATPRQVMTRWAMQHNVIPLVRSTNPEHITQNLNVHRPSLQLTDAEMQAIDAITTKRHLFPDPAQLP
jgi:diketogulonate reductase-like aldo/keto reductase